MISTIEKDINELSEICRNLDPYLPIPDYQKKNLEKFNITEFYDPFAITNKLLLLLENSIEELNKTKLH